MIKALYRHEIFLTPSDFSNKCVLWVFCLSFRPDAGTIPCTRN